MERPQETRSKLHPPYQDSGSRYRNTARSFSGRITCAGVPPAKTAPFTVPQSSTLFGINSSLVLEIPVMLAVMMIMTLPALKRGKLSRAQGIILLCIYAAFCAIQFTM